MTKENTKYDNVLRRLGATFIDLLVFIPLILVDNYVSNSYENKFAILTWLFVMSFITTFYTIYLHYKYGQTFGKMAMGIKVVDLNENNKISFRQAVIRSSIYIIIDVLGLIYFLILILSLDETTVTMTESYDYFQQMAAGILVLIEFIVILTNKKKMAIHDYIAKTVVIKINLEEKT
jgi:uncharacterized RDD family membrane protein YckC